MLKLDQKTHTATFAGQYSHGSNFDSDYMGSLEPLAERQRVRRLGLVAFITEYNASGDMLLDARLPGSDITYRAQVEPWVGLPLTPPAAAARKNAGKTTVYASWNGATEVASWRVLASTARAGRPRRRRRQVRVRDGHPGE